ncbi:MAG: type VI secretion system ATPase TssH, partial [Lachnospiraceae bacterium]|nr:type VI secretion system ATPase TssH [Lachnospiraceae bacterium]
LDGIGEDGEISETATELVTADLRNHFRPEFLNRLDETIFFKPLSRSDIGAIVKLMVADVNKRLAAKDIKVDLTEKALAYIAENGYDPQFGARPLKRYLQKHVETEAARIILQGNLSEGSRIVFSVSDGQLSAEVRKDDRTSA